MALTTQSGVIVFDDIDIDIEIDIVRSGFRDASLDRQLELPLRARDHRSESPAKVLDQRLLLVTACSKDVFEVVRGRHAAAGPGIRLFDPHVAC